MDQDYLDILKKTDLRPRKQKVVETTILLESIKEALDREIADVIAEIIKWLKSNPKPTDEDKEKFGKTMGLNVKELDTHVYMILGDFLSEGRSKDYTGEFDENQLAMGVEVEMEHTTIPCIAKKIAQDHLVENSRYYILLKQMEQNAGIKED
jgi:hypothetical protein